MHPIIAQDFNLLSNEDGHIQNGVRAILNGFDLKLLRRCWHRLGNKRFY